MSHRLVRRQIVGGTPASVFAFFKDPRNLEAMTPPWLGFRVLDATDPEVRLGTRIRYRLRLHGVPLRWESRIAEYVDDALFADEQIEGPYRRWYHRHLFREVPGGVEVADVVEYQLRLGVVGRIVHGLWVRRQIEAIFDFRARALGDLFPAAARGGVDREAVA